VFQGIIGGFHFTKRGGEQIGFCSVCVKLGKTCQLIVVFLEARSAKLFIIRINNVYLTDISSLIDICCDSLFGN